MATEVVLAITSKGIADVTTVATAMSTIMYSGTPPSVTKSWASQTADPVATTSSS